MSDGGDGIFSGGPLRSHSRGFGRWCAGPRGGLVLIAICLGVYLPGFFAMPVVDRDEARFAQASRQMLETGDYIVPRVQGTPRLNKPPLIYWLQSSTARVFSGGDPSTDRVWMYRVPSLIAALATVLLTWRLGVSMFGGAAGWLGALLIGMCPVVFWEARQARSDMVLLACSAASIWMLWELWRRTDSGRDGAWGWRAGLWLAVGAGVLTKGPVVPMIVLLAAGMRAVLTRSWKPLREIKPLLGLVLVTAMIVPWVILVAREVGWSVYARTIFDETLGRSLAPKEGHAGPPGYHLAFLAVLLFPGSMFIGPAAWRLSSRGLTWRAAEGSLPVRLWKRFVSLRAARKAESFVVCIVVPSWIVFELVSTKLPHYTLPLLPLIAIMCARTVLESTRWVRAVSGLWFVRAGLCAWMLGIAVFLIAASAAVWGALGSESGALAAGAGAIVVGGVLVVYAWREMVRGRFLRMQLAGVVGFAIGAIAIGFALPRIDQVWVTRTVVAAVRTIDPGATRPIACAEYHEDSLIFETRGRIERIFETSLDQWLRDHPTGIVVLPRSLADKRDDLRELGSAAGFNYSKGDRVDLVIAERIE